MAGAMAITARHISRCVGCRTDGGMRKWSNASIAACSSILAEGRRRDGGSYVYRPWYYRNHHSAHSYPALGLPEANDLALYPWSKDHAHKRRPQHDKDNKSDAHFASSHFNLAAAFSIGNLRAKQRSRSKKCYAPCLEHSVRCRTYAQLISKRATTAVMPLALPIDGLPARSPSEGRA